jgi:hypothetical protein
MLAFLLFERSVSMLPKITLNRGRAGVRIVEGGP